MSQFAMVSASALGGVASDIDNFAISIRSEQAFIAKHMPDLGHEIKDVHVYNWRLTNWKKLEKKITSPEFECGGHRWYVQRLLDCVFCGFMVHHAGGYYYFRLGTRMRHQMTLSLYILTMPTLSERLRDGMRVPNSHWSSRTPTIRPSTLSAVRNYNACMVLSDACSNRCTPSLYRRGVRLGLHAVQRIAKVVQCPGGPHSTNN